MPDYGIDPNLEYVELHEAKWAEEEAIRQAGAEEDARIAAEAEEARLAKQAIIDARENPPKPVDETVVEPVLAVIESVVEEKPAPKATRKK